MSRLNEWLGTNRTVRILAVIFGLGVGILALVLLFGFLITLATIAPTVAGLLAFGLVFIAAMAVARIYSDRDDSEEEASHERDSLTVLKERYARGEISEEKFEQQVTMLLDVDEIAGEKQEPELVTERN